MRRVLVIGLDACDAILFRSLVEQGRAPNIGRMLEHGGHAMTTLPDGIFLGAVWPSYTRAVEPANTGRANWINVDPDSYELGPPDKHHMGGTAVWDHLAAGGVRSIVLDVPHDFPNDVPNVIKVLEVGTHDHEVGCCSTPPEVVEHILECFGPHPLFGSFPHNDSMLFAPDDYLHRAGAMRTGEEDGALAALAVPGVEHKAAVATWLLREYPWDLAYVTFTEAHCVGHQLWHVHDPQHPRHDAELHRRIGSPMENTYIALDAAIGGLIEQVGPGTNVIVICTHGMGPMYEAVHLFEAVLGRLDASLAAEAEGTFQPPRRRWSRSLRAGYTRLPRPVRRTLAPLLAAALRRRGQRPGETVVDPEIDAATRARRRFYRSWNNDVVAGVRLNLVGRESAGTVHPDDVDGLLTWIERELHALVDVNLGRPLVARTYRCADVYPNATDTTLADLFVEFHRDALIERVWSPTVGVIHRTVSHWRTGAHRQYGMVVAAGPGINPGEHAPIASAAVPAGIARLFGVDLPGAQHTPPSWWSAP